MILKNEKTNETYEIVTNYNAPMHDLLFLIGKENDNPDDYVIINE